MQPYNLYQNADNSLISEESWMTACVNLDIPQRKHVKVSWKRLFLDNVSVNTLVKSCIDNNGDMSLVFWRELLQRYTTKIVPNLFVEFERMNKVYKIPMTPMHYFVFKCKELGKYTYGTELFTTGRRRMLKEYLETKTVDPELVKYYEDVVENSLPDFDYSNINPIELDRDEYNNYEGNKVKFNYFPNHSKYYDLVINSDSVVLHIGCGENTLLAVDGDKTSFIDQLGFSTGDLEDWVFGNAYKMKCTKLGLSCYSDRLPKTKKEIPPYVSVLTLTDTLDENGEPGSIPCALFASAGISTIVLSEEERTLTLEYVSKSE